jgi:phosphohistidine phosphatase
MKTLLLMRHGKSDWNAGEGDFERPLTKRGWDDAPMIGRMLVDAHLIPDRVLVSPAARAWTTAKLVAGAGEFPDEPVKVERLYGASVADCLGLLREQSAKIDILMLIGHNPTLEELLGELCGLGRCHLPTAAVACIDAAVEGWGELTPEACALRWLVIPRLLRRIIAKKN